MVLTKNPAKLEARAQGYEQRGKPAKAIKCRQKIARLTGMSPMSFNGNAQPQMLVAGGPMINAPFAWNTTNPPSRYENNALKWERRGNYNKANKNRVKVWRLQNPQYAAEPAGPMFYQNNQFQGYGIPFQPTVQPVAFQQQQQGFQQQGFQQQGFQQQGFQGAQVETITRPAIVQETMRPERITEVQPIVHRQIDAPQVRVVEKHMYETVPSAGPSTITNAPIIQETVKPTIIEEIQPIVHRDVPAPFVERVEQHVTEHIVQPTTTTKEVINAGSTVQQPFVAAGGAQTTTTTTNTSTTTTQKTGIMGKVQNVLHHNQGSSSTTQQY